MRSNEMQENTKCDDGTPAPNSAPVLLNSGWLMLGSGTLPLGGSLSFGGATDMLGGARLKNNTRVVFRGDTT